MTLTQHEHACPECGEDLRIEARIDAENAAFDLNDSGDQMGSYSNAGHATQRDTDRVGMSDTQVVVAVGIILAVLAAFVR